MKAAWEDLEVQRIPLLVKSFICFANRNSPKNMKFKIKFHTTVAVALSTKVHVTDLTMKSTKGALDGKHK